MSWSPAVRDPSTLISAARPALVMTCTAYLLRASRFALAPAKPTPLWYDMLT